MVRGEQARTRTTARVVVGAKSVLRVLGDPRVRRVLVAADGPDAAVAAVREAADLHGHPVVAVVTAVELGRRCGIPRPVAAAAELSVPLRQLAQDPAPLGR